MLGFRDGNTVKLGCDDCCTTITKFIEFKKKKKENLKKGRRKEGETSSAQTDPPQGC